MSAAVGVPEIKALPPPLTLSRRPLGSLPEAIFKVGVGNPDAEIVKDARLPCRKVTLDAEVNFGTVAPRRRIPRRRLRASADVTVVGAGQRRIGCGEARLCCPSLAVFLTAG